MTQTETTPQTKIDAYQDILDSGEADTKRRAVAAALAKRPMTNHELSEELPLSKNTIRPRVNELLRMDCVERDGTRANPSGHRAAVHHLTETGERYVRGEADPEPDPPLAEIRRKAVDAARDYLRGDIDEFDLKAVVAHHDRVKRRLEPEWSEGLE